MSSRKNRRRIRFFPPRTIWSCAVSQDSARGGKPHGSAGGGEAVHSARVGAERDRDGDRAVGVLVVLEHGDERAADGEAGAVQGVDEVGVRRGLAIARAPDRGSALPPFRRRAASTRGRRRPRTAAENSPSRL